MERAIPLLDLRDFTGDDHQKKMQFVADLYKAFTEIGFVCIEGHGIPDALVDEFYQLSKQFFSFPYEVKTKYEVEGLAGQRGYTSFGKEHAKQSKVGDLKEFFQIGQTVVGEDEIRSEYPDNVVVTDLPAFSELGIRLYRSFEASGAQLLRAIALGLGLHETYFEEKIRNGNSILRAIHYPPILQEPDSAIRSEQHEDINLITLLVGASAGGLQVLTRRESPSPGLGFSPRTRWAASTTPIVNESAGSAPGTKAPGSKPLRKVKYQTPSSLLARIGP